MDMGLNEVVGGKHFSAANSNTCVTHDLRPAKTAFSGPCSAQCNEYSRNSTDASRRSQEELLISSVLSSVEAKPVNIRGETLLFITSLLKCTGMELSL